VGRHRPELFAALERQAAPSRERDQLVPLAVGDQSVDVACELIEVSQFEELGGRPDSRPASGRWASGDPAQATA